MPERPLIVLPRPVVSEAAGRTPRWPPRPHFPNAGRQEQRLTPQFQALQQYFAQQTAMLQATAAGAAAEEVVVFETVGSIQNFIAAVRRIPGMEWLAEQEEEFSPDADFFNTNDENEMLSGRLYLVMSNQQAIQQLLFLWQHYRANPNQAFAHGLAKWKQLFAQLHDVHVWDVQDRLRDTGVLKYWEEAVAIAGNQKVRCEVELWYRADSQKQARAYSAVSQAVSAAHGDVLAQTVIDDIAYHGVLIDLPRDSVAEIVAHPDNLLLRSSEIMLFRPVGQSVFVSPVDAPLPGSALASHPLPTGSPRVAILDGFPVENHQLLAGRLVLDDPDGWAAMCPIQHRQHGTAMASLVVRGELDTNDVPLNRPVYMRPLLKPNPNDWVNNPPREGLPSDVLTLDLVHRAVLRIVHGEGGLSPVAPDVRVINLSIGDPDQLFDRTVSAWARLLDWLSWKYNVLFVVSAGNHASDIILDIPRAGLSALTTDELQKQTIVAIARDVRNRRLLSPSEAINVLTVGALHTDRSNLQHLGHRKNPFVEIVLPSPISASGSGFRGAIKPEILMPGGRQLYTEKMGNTHANATLQVARYSSEPGHKVAAPGTQDGDISAIRYMCGTSDAAALATRGAARIDEIIAQLRTEPNGDTLGEDHGPVLIKALLVHGAQWGQAYGILEPILRNGAHLMRFKQQVARFLGYGASNINRVVNCTEARATLVGCGTIQAEEAHQFSVPLPPCLSGQRVPRRLTVTLAWFSPINPRHRNYRTAALSVDPPRSELRVERKECNFNSVQRGTVQHEILEGEAATAFANGDILQFTVNCRADAGEMTVPIHYGIAVSLEVGVGVTLPIYDEVRVRVRPPVAITAR
jgi:hypothetical protein